MKGRKTLKPSDLQKSRRLCPDCGVEVTFDKGTLMLMCGVCGEKFYGAEVRREDDGH